MKKLIILIILFGIIGGIYLITRPIENELKSGSINTPVSNEPSIIENKNLQGTAPSIQ